MSKTDICKDMALLNPIFRKIVEEGLRRCIKKGIKAKVSETFRYAERQTMLFKAGKSKAKAGYSMHEYGCAVDIFNNVKGHEYDPKIMKEIHEIMQSVNKDVLWGGDFKGFVDTPHFQYTHPYTEKEIRSGKSPK